jgi:hypothetical protein
MMRQHEPELCLLASARIRSTRQRAIRPGDERVPARWPAGPSDEPVPMKRTTPLTLADHRNFIKQAEAALHADPHLVTLA